MFLPEQEEIVSNNIVTNPVEIDDNVSCRNAIAETLLSKVLKKNEILTLDTKMLKITVNDEVEYKKMYL